MRNYWGTKLLTEAWIEMIIYILNILPVCFLSLGKHVNFSKHLKYKINHLYMLLKL
jgi:hypothetical protein